METLKKGVLWIINFVSYILGVVLSICCVAVICASTLAAAILGELLCLLSPKVGSFFCDLCKTVKNFLDSRM